MRPSIHYALNLKKNGIEVKKNKVCQSKFFRIVLSTGFELFQTNDPQCNSNLFLYRQISMSLGFFFQAYDNNLC